MRIIIFGGSGRTGQIISRAAEAKGHELLLPSHQACNLANAAEVSRVILSSEAQAVINAAAVSNLEACSDDPLQAHLVNALAPAAMALACRHTGARFIHLSTDYVLDGRRPGKKGEHTKCRPENIYGESKHEGERQIAEANTESLILRVSWIMGNPDRPSFVEQTLRRAMQGTPPAAIADKWSMPTDAEDIARVALSLLDTSASGIFHVCSGGDEQSWHSCAVLALEAAAEFGEWTTPPHVVRLKLDEVSFFRERRPRHTAMDNAKLLALGIPMPDAKETLRRVTQRYLAHLKRPQQRRPK